MSVCMRTCVCVCMWVGVQALVRVCMRADTYTDMVDICALQAEVCVFVCVCM